MLNYEVCEIQLTLSPGVPGKPLVPGSPLVPFFPSSPAGPATPGDPDSPWNKIIRFNKEQEKVILMRIQRFRHVCALTLILTRSPLAPGSPFPPSLPFSPYNKEQTHLHYMYEFSLTVVTQTIGCFTCYFRHNNLLVKYRRLVISYTNSNKTLQICNSSIL